MTDFEIKIINKLIKKAKRCDLLERAFLQNCYLVASENGMEFAKPKTYLKNFIKKEKELKDEI